MENIYIHHTTTIGCRFHNRTQFYVKLSDDLFMYESYPKGDVLSFSFTSHWQSFFQLHCFVYRFTPH